jgi:EAL domain-containing protein (putative c-di-GMP-specific phosphodiesterase class I)
MGDQQREEAANLVPFGQRKVAPHVWIADGKAHIRKFIGEALEELGFIACECGDVGQLNRLFDEQLQPGLMVVGLSSGGIEAAAILEALAARKFGGKVLVLGPRDSLMVAAIQELGERLGIAMLPTLNTPFDGESLRNSAANLVTNEERPKLIVDAAEALSSGWLELWYQPKFNTHTLELCGIEALLRVRHPTWGVVPPAQFLPDNSDPHFHALSDFVIGRAIDDWRNFIAQCRGVEIAINLPIAFFQQPDAVEHLFRRMPDHPAFDGLIIEIDAADAIQNMDLVNAAARQLRLSNIAISLDDLGLDWPSLVGLRDFPFVEIKVDRHFIMGCADNRLKRTVCRQILDLADSFGARTVAEGVETRADFFAVREMDFDVVQGFLFAKPATANKVVLNTLRQPVTIPQ